MLAALEPWELCEIIAAYSVVPFDNGWEQAGTIAAAVHNEMERYMAGKAGKRQVEKNRWHSRSHYIPKLKRLSAKPKVDRTSIDTYERLIESQYSRK
jgi:hypothetical protein